MQAYSVMSDSLWPHGLRPTSLLCAWDYSYKNTGVIAISSSGRSPWSKDQTCISYVSCIGRWIPCHWATWGPLIKVEEGPLSSYMDISKSISTIKMKRSIWGSPQDSQPYMLKIDNLYFGRKFKWWIFPHNYFLLMGIWLEIGFSVRLST